MKVPYFHKAVAISMAFLVLFSTFSFAIEKHYCGDFLIDAAVFSEVKRCSSESSEIAKKPCCKDVFDLVEGQDELHATDGLQLDFDTQVFLASWLFTEALFFEALPKQHIPYYLYDPPDLVEDIQLLDEVFLI